MSFVLAGDGRGVYCPAYLVSGLAVREHPRPGQTPRRFDVFHLPAIAASALLASSALSGGHHVRHHHHSQSKPNPVLVAPAAKVPSNSVPTAQAPSLSITQAQQAMTEMAYADPQVFSASASCTGLSSSEALCSYSTQQMVLGAVDTVGSFQYHAVYLSPGKALIFNPYAPGWSTVEPIS